MEVIENPQWAHVLESLDEEQKAQLMQEYAKACQEKEQLSLAKEQQQVQELQALQHQQQ